MWETKVFVAKGHFCSFGTKSGEYLMDLYNVFNMTSRGVQRAVSTEPRDYLVSSNAVQQVQNSHMARKRKITHQPDPCQCNKLILFCV